MRKLEITVGYVAPSWVNSGSERAYFGDLIRAFKP